jgi:hypothetical protein
MLRPAMLAFALLTPGAADDSTTGRTALALRAKTYIASLDQTGRVLLMEAKLADAEDLYRRTVQIGDLAKAPDDEAADRRRSQRRQSRLALSRDPPDHGRLSPCSDAAQAKVPPARKGKRWRHDGPD